jgi:hypothetical protein
MTSLNYWMLADLIYINPPFNSNRNYEVFWGETKETRAFEDRQFLLPLRLARRALRQGDARPDSRREQFSYSKQMRHADLRTTLRVYAHVISKTHREFMESVGQRSIGTNVPIGTERNA